MGHQEGICLYNSKHNVYCIFALMYMILYTLRYMMYGICTYIYLYIYIYVYIYIYIYAYAYAYAYVYVNVYVYVIRICCAAHV